MKTFVEGSTTFLVGENASDNWKIVFDMNQSPNYVWVHLDRFPSPSIVIVDDEPSDDIIREAGFMCLQHTKYRNLKMIKFCYTRIGNLKKGSAIGEFEFISNRQVSTAFCPTI